MKNKLSTLAIVSFMALGLNACCQDKDDMKKSSDRYEKTEVSKDANGTTTERQTSSDYDRDDNGHKKVVVKTKTTKDPKGLFNKTTTNESKEVDEDK